MTLFTLAFLRWLLGGIGRILALQLLEESHALLHLGFTASGHRLGDLLDGLLGTSGRGNAARSFRSLTSITAGVVFFCASTGSLAIVIVLMEDWELAFRATVGSSFDSASAPLFPVNVGYNEALASCGEGGLGGNFSFFSSSAL